jgi:diguanylate cyclase (GGDEF)-like protein
MISNRFRAQLILAALVPSVLLAMVLSYLWLTWSQRALEDALRQRLDAHAAQLATAAEFHLFSGDDNALLSLANGALSRDADLVAVAMLDTRGTILARASRPGWVADLGSAPLWPARDAQHLSRLVKPVRQSPLVIDDPVAHAGELDDTQGNAPVLGHIVLVVSLDQLHRQRDEQLHLGLASIFLALLAASVLAIYLADGVTRPLTRVMSVVNRIGQGDKEARVDPSTGSVLYPLEIGINRMAESVALTQKELQARIDAATDLLQAQKRLAELEARIDALTGLHNRRALLERGELEMHRADRHGTPLALIILDLDHFKMVNDSHGHGAGDRVLVGLAQVLLHAIRDIDFVARLGGEEFVVLMPDTDTAAARGAAERMRRAVAAMRVPIPTGVLECTASFGIAQYLDGDMDMNRLLVRADEALYEAKAAGRDCVRVAGDLHASGGG